MWNTCPNWLNQANQFHLLLVYRTLGELWPIEGLQSGKRSQTTFVLPQPRNTSLSCWSCSRRCCCCSCSCSCSCLNRLTWKSLATATAAAAAAAAAAAVAAAMQEICLYQTLFIIIYLSLSLLIFFLFLKFYLTYQPDKKNTIIIFKTHFFFSLFKANEKEVNRERNLLNQKIILCSSFFFFLLLHHLLFGTFLNIKCLVIGRTSCAPTFVFATWSVS